MVLTKNTNYFTLKIPYSTKWVFTWYEMDSTKWTWYETTSYHNKLHSFELRYNIYMHVIRHLMKKSLSKIQNNPVLFLTRPMGSPYSKLHSFELRYI